MNREEYIRNRIIEHKDYLIKNTDYEVIYISLQGSQNYGLDIYDDDYKSDVDTKAIIVPNFEDFVYDKKTVSTTIVLPNNEHIDVKDIRIMFDTFKKQNINFLEILFTEYYFMNLSYKDLLKPLFDNKERIARLNYNQALRCMAGMSKEKLKALQYPYPTIKDKIDKYGYDGKQLHHILRMNDFMLQYVNGTSYEDCLKPKTFSKELLIKAKKNGFSCEDAIEIANKIDEETYELKNSYLLVEDLIDTEALDILNKVKYDVLKYKFKKDLNKED